MGFLLNRRKGLFFAQSPQEAFCCAMVFAQSPQGLERFALAQAVKAFHFFCPNKRNETKKIRRLHFFAYSGTFLR